MTPDPEPRGAEREGWAPSGVWSFEVEEEIDRLVAEGKVSKRIGADGEMYLSLPGSISEREYLEADRAFVARMIEEPDDQWGTRRIMWQQRLAAIDGELAALSDPAPQPSDGETS